MATLRHGANPRHLVGGAGLPLPIGNAEFAATASNSAFAVAGHNAEIKTMPAQIGDERAPHRVAILANAEQRSGIAMPECHQRTAAMLDLTDVNGRIADCRGAASIPSRTVTTPSPEISAYIIPWLALGRLAGKWRPRVDGGSTTQAVPRFQKVPDRCRRD